MQSRKRIEIGDAYRIQAELWRLAAEMEAHFDREERQLVPALNSLPASVLDSLRAI